MLDPQRVFLSRAIIILEILSYVTLFAGVDPADQNKMLVRKLVRLNKATYAYEETRVSREDSSVHTNLVKVHGFDLNEKMTN